MKDAFSWSLVYVYPVLLWTLLSCWLLSAGHSLNRLRRRAEAAHPGAWTLALGLVFLALILRLARPGVHRVFYDEFEHLDAARHLAATGAFAETLVGGLPSWDVLRAPTWPGGHHAALATVLRVFGPDARAAFAFSAALGALAVLLVFWAAFEAFRDARGALAAAAAWAVLPLALRWSSAADLTSSSVFWIAACLAAIHSRENEPDGHSDLFAALTLSYAVQIRPENAVLIVYALFVLTKRSLAVPSLLGFLVPLGLAISNRSSGLPGYASGDTSFLSNLSRQLVPNLRYLAAPGILSLLFVPGVLVGLRRRPARAMLALALAFLLAYSCFYRGRFDAAAEDRFALSVALPLGVAAAAGFAQAAGTAAALALALSFLAPARPEPGPPAESILAASPAVAAAPAGAVVIAFNPSAARELFHRPAVWAPLVLGNAAAFEKSRAGSAPELLLFKDWAWRARPAQSAALEAALSRRYAARPLAEEGSASLVLLTPRY